jgi:hypothetical protein
LWIGQMYNYQLVMHRSTLFHNDETGCRWMSCLDLLAYR